MKHNYSVINFRDNPVNVDLILRKQYVISVRKGRAKYATGTVKKTKHYDCMLTNIDSDEVRNRVNLRIRLHEFLVKAGIRRFDDPRIGPKIRRLLEKLDDPAVNFALPAELLDELVAFNRGK